MRRIALVACMAMASGACKKDDPSDALSADTLSTPDVLQRDTTPESEALESEQTTYHGRIRGLIEEQCVSCHTVGGGAPFQLGYDEDEWASGPPWWAPSVVRTVSEGSMPPWQIEPDCRPVMHERVLSTEEIEAFEAWQAQGFPEGEREDYIEPKAPGEIVSTLGDASIRLDAGASYVANPQSPDDYRCFIVGDTFDEDTYITAVSVDADQTSIVHHVLIYAIDPAQVAAVEAKDAADETLGYTCFGGPGVGGAETLFAWAPGGVPFVLPEDSALLIKAGSRVVMQLHYNLAYLASDELPPPDRSEALLWAMPPGQAPNALVRVLPFANLDIDIEAGSPSVVEERDFALPFTGTIIGVVPHMHVLGQTIRSEHIAADGAETCMVDIRDWDFNWQQFYLYDEAHHIEAKGGDVHRLTCSYDNSPENQPVVNGEQMTPRQVGWGDGTFDEMCLSYLVVKTPFEVDGGVCSGVPTCAQSCDDGDFDCLLGCTLSPGAACIQCLGTLLIECGGEFCPDETAEAVACLSTECGDDTLECVRETCNQHFNALHGCLNQPMLEGRCDGYFEPCELTF